MPSSTCRLALCLLILTLTACGDEGATGPAAVGPCGTAEASASVRGQVAVPACNETLVGAEVELYDELLLGKLSTGTTNADGEFSLPLPADGRYILLAGKGPYKGRSDVFAVAGTCPYQVIVVQ